MKAQKKRSRNKTRGITYKGQYIESNSVYATGLNYKTVLFYCPIQGVELYFRTISRAKRYLDSIQYQSAPKKVTTNKLGFIVDDLYDDIPF